MSGGKAQTVFGNLPQMPAVSLFLILYTASVLSDAIVAKMSLNSTLKVSKKCFKELSDKFKDWKCENIEKVPIGYLINIISEDLYNINYVLPHSLVSIIFLSEIIFEYAFRLQYSIIATAIALGLIVTYGVLLVMIIQHFYLLTIFIQLRLNSKKST